MINSFSITAIARDGGSMLVGIRINDRAVDEWATDACAHQDLNVLADTATIVFAALIKFFGSLASAQDRIDPASAVERMLRRGFDRAGLGFVAISRSPANAATDA